MPNTYMQLYEIPTRHFLPVTNWLYNNGLSYFTKFGFSKSLIQVAGSELELEGFREFLSELWVLKETTVFPKRYEKLVTEELSSWGIPYRKVRNPFAFEIVTEIDERRLERFLSAIRELTKKPKREGKKAAGVAKAKKDKSPVPNDISSLLE